MARGKKVKTGSKVRGAPHGGQSSSGRSPKSARPHSYDADREMPAFSLRDAARTEHNSTFWSSNLNLRHRAIGFVRSNEPNIPNDSETIANESSTLTQDDILIPPSPSPPVDFVQLPQENSDHVDVLSALDNALSESILQPEPPPARSPSPAISNSSDEIVLFKGRRGVDRPTEEKRIHVPAIPEPVINSAPAFSAQPRRSVVDEPVHVIVAIPPVQIQNHRKRGKDAAQLSSYSRSATNAVSRSPDFSVFPRREVPRKKDRRKREREMELEDQMLEDYLANMRESGEIDNFTADQDTSGAEENDLGSWASSDMDAFDELSTSNEVLASVQQVLAKRQRPSGIQYLVVWDGYTVDDARWIPHTSLTMDGAAHLIASFEEAQKYIIDLTPSSDESEEQDDVNHSEIDDDDDDGDDDDDDDDEDDEDEDEDEDFDDEKDLIERRLARLSDERLARLLAKQEDLGLGSDELVLFDEMFADEDEDDGDEDSDVELQMALAMSRSKRKPKKGHLDLLQALSDVAMDGDDYGDFDVMDRERASLGQGKKKHSDPMTWGLSDSEQAEGLSNAWAADRKKKKAKKQEREELRAQGLLGKKNKFKPDLKARYNQGMDIDQFGKELEEFLFADYESHALPPMDKRDRKAVHEIATKFGLKSLSKGSGNSRFPVLYKTSKTVPFDAFLFRRLRSQSTRKFYERPDMKSKGGRSANRGRGGGGPSSGVSRGDTGYRAGDVVGGTAPELGAENRGRAMLEKMGWTSGNALGALDNKGILQPIAHVIRNSRAGLG